MHRKIFPRCRIIGPTDPVPFCHLVIRGAIPRKCQSCAHLFEGECLRTIEETQGYLSLDHGPCPVKGSTHPVLVETPYYKSRVHVPAKCERCAKLELNRIHGFVCNLDRERWGAFPRTLDWGSWSPEHPNLGLKTGRSVSHEVISAVANGSEVQAIKAFRSSHPDATFREARDAYAELLAQLGD